MTDASRIDNTYGPIGERSLLQEREGMFGRTKHGPIRLQGKISTGKTGMCRTLRERWGTISHRERARLRCAHWGRRDELINVVRSWWGRYRLDFQGRWVLGWNLYGWSRCANVRVEHKSGTLDREGLAGGTDPASTPGAFVRSLAC